MAWFSISDWTSEATIDYSSRRLLPLRLLRRCRRVAWGISKRGSLDCASKTASSDCTQRDLRRFRFRYPISTCPIHSKGTLRDAQDHARHLGTSSPLDLSVAASLNRSTGIAPPNPKQISHMRCISERSRKELTDPCHATLFLRKSISLSLRSIS